MLKWVNHFFGNTVQFLQFYNSKFNLFDCHQNDDDRQNNDRCSPEAQNVLDLEKGTICEIFLHL